MGEKYFTLDERIRILAEGTKYDSCNSTTVCHTFTPDGRCIQLYKTLLTNSCCGECLYCPNRCGRETARASLSPGEIVKITWDFYRRNAIEGLFLSSGVTGDPELTTERQLEVVRKLRATGFTGYIHVRLMPGVPRDLIREISLYVNKFGVNAETTCKSRYEEICPNFDYDVDILRRMAWAHDFVKQRRQEIRYVESDRKITATIDRSGIVGANDTQFVVGASGEPDLEIIRTIGRFMDDYGLRRPFFMSFDPVKGTPLEGGQASPLWREARLYQLSYLMKDYGLKARSLEMVLDDNGFLSNEDPKLMLARLSRDDFPVDVNEATYGELIRVPGIGPRSAHRILRCRPIRDYVQLADMGIVLKRARPFIKVGRYRQAGLEAYG
jgi:predicted DNA-binding helix-hairpin-helix protein